MANSAFSPTTLTLPSTGGTGQGELNLVLNSVGAADNTGWVGATRQSGGGPLNPTVSTYFTVSNAAVAEGSSSGGYYAFTLPSGLQNRKLKVEFYYTTPANDQYAVSVYKAGTRVPLSTDSSSVTNLPKATTGKFTAYFDTDSTGSWTLNITRTSGTTGPISFTQVVVGPGIQPQGAVVGEWTSYTPTFTGLGTVSNVSGWYRRVGDLLELRGYVTTGTTTATAATLSLPSGFNVNTAVIAGTQKDQLGQWFSGGSGNPNFGNTTTAMFGFLLSDTANTSVLYFTGSGSSTLFQETPGNQLAGSNVGISFRAQVSVSQWAGSGTVQLAQNDVEYAWNSAAWGDSSDPTSFGYGPVGAPFTNTDLSIERYRRVRFQTPIQPGDKLELEVKINDKWLPLAGAVTPTNVYNFTPFGYYIANSTNTVGVGIRTISGNSTDVDVWFGRWFTTVGGNTATVSWSQAIAAADSGKVYWRVRKSSAGAAVGVGLVAQSSAGLMPASNSNLDDASATRLGLKQYLHGTAYSGGSSPTLNGPYITCNQAGFSVVRGVTVPYQVQDGTWRLRISFVATITATSSAINTTVGINGVTFKNLTNYYQALSGGNAGTSLGNFQRSITNPNTGQIFFDTAAGTSVTIIMVSGDVELDSKPTWAYS